MNLSKLFLFQGKFRPWLRRLLAFSLAFMPAVALSGAGKSGDHLPDQLLVAPAANLPAHAWAAILNAHGLREESVLPQIGVRVVRVPPAQLETVLKALNRNPRIEFAEKNYTAGLLLTPNDPLYPDQWHLPRISAPVAWDVTTGRADQIIAIIDTGVRSNHPDLVGKVLPGYNFISNNTNSEDDNGHGTLVAGAAAAIGNNSEGLAGVAWKNWILPVKSLNSSGGGSHATIANGINYAADNGARVINLSLGSPSSSRTLQRAVSYAWKKNCLLVAAAGNSGDDSPFYPAAYDQVIGVSALDSNDKLPSWGTYGNHVSIAAPGVSILSTHRNGSYGRSSGSSFSSPLVAGSAGLVLAVDPALDNSALRRVLETTADNIGSSYFYGAGRLNAAAAVNAVAGKATKDTTPPTVTIVNPDAGSTVSGTVEVQIDSFDDVGVEQVELYLAGALYAKSSKQVVSFPWDTTAYTNGEIALEARAYDAAGNVGTSAAVNVAVNNGSSPGNGGDEDAVITPLTVAITSPNDGDKVTRVTRINVEASGGIRVVLLELFVNGSLLDTAVNTSSNEFNWNTNRASRGEHTLQAFAHDETGEVVSSAVITVVK
jgi:thermitase